VVLHRQALWVLPEMEQQSMNQRMRGEDGEPMADILKDMIEVLKVIAKDLEVIEQRVWKLEHE
jgi:4-alpha-glucanotransferase